MQLAWGLAFPEATKEGPCGLRRKSSTHRNPRTSRRFSPPGEMRPISAEASRGYSHLTSGTSKGSFTPLLQLKKFPDIPVSTREEARESHHHPEEPRFRLLALEEGSFPCVVGKEFPAFPSHLKRRCSHRKGVRNSRVVPHSQSPPDVSVHSRETCFPCTASSFKQRIDSHHGGTWDSPVGKPRGKAS